MGEHWLLVTVLGVILLGLALWYGQHQSNIFRRDRRAVRRQNEATRRQYEE